MNGRIVAACTCAGFVAAALLYPAMAHEGHGRVQAQDFDLNAPRTVSTEAAAVIGLQTAEADFGTMEEILRITGTVRPLPSQVQEIAPHVGGIIAALAVEVGDIVHKGDVVGEVESPEVLALMGELSNAEGQVQRLTVQVETGRASLEVIEEEFARVTANQAVIAANTVSGRRGAAITARGQQANLEAELTQARLQLKALQRQLTQINSGLGSQESGRIQLLAAIDGVVISRTAMVGAGVAPGEGLLRIANFARVQVEGELPESLVQRLGAAAGQAVRLRSSSGGAPVATGQVRFVSPTIDPSSRTTHVLIDVDNPQGLLREGQWVEASIVLRTTTEAVVVPASSLLSDGPVQFVFIREGKAGNVFRKHDVTPGVGDDLRVEILKGVVPGDVVVTQGGYSLVQMRAAAAVPGAGLPGSTSPAPAPGAGGSHGHTH